MITESLTGNTRRAGNTIAELLSRDGVDVLGTYRTEGVDHAALQAADLVVIGTWVHGIFVVGMAPWGASKLANLPAMRGKQIATFCTYALNPGSTLDKLDGIARGLGGDSLGGLAIRRTKLTAGAQEFTDRVLSVVRD